jgi:glycosyl transferase family 25
VNGAQIQSQPRWSHLGAGEIGCLLSHIEAWRLIAQADNEHGFVLEDDIHVSNDFGDLVRTISLDSGELCIHKLETFYANVTLARRPAYTVRSRRAYKLETNHAGTGAYIINRRTASHLLHYVDSFDEAIDTELFNPVRRKVKDLTIYQWVPAPCIQDFLMGEAQSNKALASNIGKDRWGVRFYPVRRSQRLKTAVKARLRTVYTKLYSVWLAQSGRMRKRIEFK